MEKVLIVGCKRAMDDVCIVDHCPHKETLISKIKAKAGIPVVEVTHPYKPANFVA